MELEKKWPNDYPVHIAIPPEDAIPITKNLYRLVKTIPPNSADFLASYKDPKQMRLIKNHENNPHFYGTSFFDTKKTLNDIVEGSPERFKNENLASGLVTPDHGVAVIGNKKHAEHVTVWFYDGVFPDGFLLV